MSLYKKNKKIKKMKTKKKQFTRKRNRLMSVFHRIPDARMNEWITLEPTWYLIIAQFLHFHSYSLSASGNYRIPLIPNRTNSLEYISTFPLSPHPEVFGLHENADINRNNKETAGVTNSYVLTMQITIIAWTFFLLSALIRSTSYPNTIASCD